ncbi:DUF309 domain-containing protein [Bacillus sinesaloumensis]|uniref:DUF309 domain-containing protein n=1 Tax=Litchfieldia sinesaloumensis TaxID=1926280 RepID=UPI0009882FF8|nr:DUF309 domain-containing protein [Bacillus sinesaloumensis]
MYPQAFIDYLLHFHCDRDYFECHEVLEEHWKKKPIPERSIFWVGLIQIAVSLYHHRRGNLPGALRMMKSAWSICKDQKDELARLGFQVDKLVVLLDKKVHDIKRGEPYESINLPLENNLLTTCSNLASQSGLSWGVASDLSNKQLVHKHKLRDRSDIIAEREEQIRHKRKLRQIQKPPN